MLLEQKQIGCRKSFTKLRIRIVLNHITLRGCFKQDEDKFCTTFPTICDESLKMRIRKGRYCNYYQLAGLSSEVKVQTHFRILTVEMGSLGLSVEMLSHRTSDILVKIESI